MADDKKLTPADPADVANALAFAMRFNGRKRVHDADDMMAQIAAKRLVEHLALSGFVVMKKPPASLHSDAAHRSGSDGRSAEGVAHVCLRLERSDSFDC
jgi:hypothetical protein